MADEVDANWDEFNPNLYLTENYSHILPPDREILTKLAKFYKENPPRRRFMEVGCGPNLYPVLAALPYCGSADIVEYGGQNLAYLRQQVVQLQDIWQQWIDLLRQIDPVYNVDFQEQLKSKAVIKQGSIFELPQGVYDAVSMHFVSESITEDMREFDLANRRFIGALRPGGIFVASFMENSQGYSSPGRPFPAVAITTEDIQRSFGPLTSSLDVQTVSAGEGVVRTGHTGMLTVMGCAK